MTTETLFQSGQAALNFAYRHSHGDYPSNLLGRAQKRGPAAAAPAPRGLDAAMAAGWVRQVIEGGAGHPGLPEPYRSVLLAKFSVDSHLNLAAKLRILEDVLALSLGTGLHKRRMVDLCVQRYFGGTVICAGERRPIRQHQVADWCDVSQQTVSATYVKVKTWLAAKERTAMELVERELVRKGMV
ncbi:hypothetical protein [Polaromonas sp.]|uniref:hypothetical protein n=1 Tax=Polaromonas sp. TaxID=1869339 RepID=UPI0032638D31